MTSSIFLNTGMPLIIGEWIMMLFGLVFIVAIEVYVYNKHKQDLKKSIRDISIANIVSTAFGVPLANAMRYLVMTVLTLVMPSAIFQHKEEYVWETLSPGKFYTLHLWEHFFIVAFILAINYIVTVYVEYWTLRYLNKQEERKDLKRQSFIFNSYSYAIITILVLVYELYYRVYIDG